MSATDFFVTPDGAGQKDGSNWENAMGLTEFYAKMKFVFNQTPVNDYHTGEEFYFGTGTYNFTSTIFISRSSVSFKGGYDATTGELSTTERTVFNGNNKARSNGALFIQSNSERNEDGKKRIVNISGIDFENFITNNEWRGNDTNWQHGMPSAIYIMTCGYAEISDCNFRNNKCVATGSNAMAGAISLNKVNALIRNCSFTGNEGTNGGAVKLYYNIEGNWVKNVYLTVDGCYFSGNKATDNGGALYGRNAMQVNIINTTIVGNEATNGGGVFNNGAGNYDGICNVVSSTIAGNTATAGSEVYTNGKGVLNVTNSIIVAGDDVDAIVDATETAGFKFNGNNIIGNVAEGYVSTKSDDISITNNFTTVFGDNVPAADGTLSPVKFMAGMDPDAITGFVTEEGWPYAVDATVDQLGNARTTGKSNGAIAISDTTTGIDDVPADLEVGDESWYTLKGLRLTGCPTVSGIYIHKGRKVLVLK